MELLLVVAVLAIVAAAAAPTFFGGAQEAMEEAKKSSYMSAYQNCVSGTNLLMGIAASQGIIPNANLSFTNKDDEAKTLENYAPRAARVFTNKNGKTYIFGATYDTTNHKVVIGFAEGNDCLTLHYSSRPGAARNRDLNLRYRTFVFSLTASNHREYQCHYQYDADYSLHNVPPHIIKNLLFHI